MEATADLSAVNGWRIKRGDERAPVVKEAWKAILWLTGMALWVFGAAAVGDCRDIQIMQAQEMQVNMQSEGMLYPGTGFRRVPKEKGRPKVDADTAYLRNGDKVSGVLEKISDGVAVLRSELVPRHGGLRIPVGNVSSFVFKTQEERWPERRGRIVFVNGDSVSVDLKGYDGNELVVETEISDEVRVKDEYVEGISFGAEPRVIYRADFEGDDSCGFKAGGSKWGLSEGRFGPADDSSPDNGAWVKLRQEGRVGYEWEVATEKGSINQASFSFFAQRPHPNALGNGYSVRISGRSVYLYKTFQNNMQYVGTFNLPIYRTSRKFGVDYDANNGRLRLMIDGEEVIAGEFKPPITSGEYIVLSARAEERFDNIVVRQLTDSVLPPAGEEAKNSDCVFLANGDRVSGEMVAVSEGKAVIKTGYSGEAIEVPMEKVSSVRFGGVKEKSEGELATISLRSGDRLSGEAVTLEKGELRFRSPYLGVIGMDAEEVSEMVFPGGAAGVEAADGPSNESNLTHIGRIDAIRSGRPVPVFAD